MKQQKQQITEFVQVINGVRNKIGGIVAGRTLVVAFPSKFDDTAVQIFSVITGRPLVNVRFANTTEGIRDAMKVAKWLEEVYGDYLEIPTAKGFEDADIINLCQWTIPNGIQIRLAFEMLEEAHKSVEFMTATYVTRAYDLAEPEVKKWLNYVRPR